VGAPRTNPICHGAFVVVSAYVTSQALIMNTNLSPLRASALTSAELVARRNLERARVLGNAIAVARAARWYAQVRQYAATVRGIA
jgi:hypothetical protein